MIMNHFPYKKARKCQEDTLLAIEKEWLNYDVFIVRAPVAAGKSGIAVAIQSWADVGCIITPNNMLRDQYMKDFKQLKTVKNQDKYWLSKYNMTEKEFRRKIYKYGPKGSEYEKDRRAVKRVSTPVVSNYHAFIAHKLQRKLLIVDEAHSLLSTLQDIHSRKIWRHMYGYPLMASTPADVLDWIESKGEVSGLLAKLRNSIRSLSDGTILEMGQEYYRGASCDCLKLIPLDVSSEAPIFWPNKTKKIILMSATIGKSDIKDMGLSTRRVLYLDVESPIPEAQRPIRFVPVAKMGHRDQVQSIPEIADALFNLASQNEGKGFVHATYDIALKLRPILSQDSRFLFHNDKDDKDNIFDEFKLSKDKILVGSGFFEGIDLKYELATWQVMVQVPYPSLMNPAYRYLAKHKPEAYLWKTSKDILQASGRVCRDPTDYGITYLLDSRFRKWYLDAKSSLPKWFIMRDNQGKEIV